MADDSSPRSLRLSREILERLRRVAGRDPDARESSVAVRLLDEGLRKELHPGIHFRTTPSGRQAVVVGGREVWEIVRDIVSAREHEPDLSESELMDLIVTNAGTTRRHQGDRGAVLGRVSG